MPNEVLDAWRRKYPGAYDSVDDRVLADAIVRKYPGAYDEKLKDVLGPRKIPPAKTPAIAAAAPAAGAPTPTAPGGVPSTPSGALSVGIPQLLPAPVRGAIEDVQISAGKTVTSLATSAAKFGTHALFPLGGSVPNEIIRLANAGQKTVDEWLEGLRTEKAPKQPKIPVLEQTPTEATGMILGGAMIPLPGGGATGKTIAARAISYLKNTLFGTAAFTAVQALPEYLEAKTEGARDAILNSLPKNVLGQFLVAAGMFGVHEFGGRVSKKDAPFVAAVTEQNGQVPETFTKRKMTAAEVKAAGIVTGRPAPEEPKPEPHPKIVEKIKKDARAKAMESLPMKEEEIPESWKAPAPPVKVRKAMEKLEGVKRQAANAKAQVDQAVADKTSAGVIERLKNSQKYWEGRVKFWQDQIAQGETPHSAASELHEVADEAHAQALIDRGEAEAKIATSDEGSKKPPKGPGPPKTAYDGGSPVPSTGFNAMLRKWFAPISLAPKEFQEQWVHMWESIDAARWDADRNRDIALKTIPDEKMRSQANNYLTGLPIDPALPALDGQTSKYIELQRQTIETAIDTLKDHGYISANRFHDILVSMFADRVKARNRLAGPMSNKEFAGVPASELWTLFADGVRNRKLKPVTNDMATMVSLLETRIATAAAQQKLKLVMKTIPALTITARPGEAPPKGYTTVKAGHMQGFYVQEDAARVLNNLYSRSQWDEVQPLIFLKKTQEVLKRTAVAISGFHHQAIFRTMLSTGHFDPAGALKGLKAITDNSPIARELAIHGLQNRGARPDISELIEREAVKVNPNAAQKFVEWWNTKLWGEHVPGAITYGAMAHVQELMKSHPDWPMDKVYDEAAKKANISFGLQNLERLGRNKTFQDTLRFLLFAPTWTETRLRMFFGAGKEATTLLTGRGTLADTMYLRQTVGHALVAGMIGEVLNLAINGPDQKGSTRRWGEFSVPFLKDKRGKPLLIDTLMYLRDPVEFVMHPSKAAANLTKYVKGRRSQVLSWMMEEAANADWKDQPLRRPEVSLWEDLKKEAGHTASHFLPIIVQHTMDGMNLMEAEISDFKDNAGRDIAAFFGYRTRSDYPIELRLKMESQMRNHQVFKNQILGLRKANQYEEARKLAKQFNDRAQAIEDELKQSGYESVLGPWWAKQRRFAYIR